MQYGQSIMELSNAILTLDAVLLILSIVNKSLPIHTKEAATPLCAVGEVIRTYEEPEVKAFAYAFEHHSFMASKHI